MRRRDFIVLLSSTVTTWPLAALGQQQAQRSPPMVGMLWAGKSAGPSLVKACREGLQEEGFEEDKNIRTQDKYGDDLEALRRGADDLVRLNVNVIVVHRPGRAHAIVA